VQQIFLFAAPAFILAMVLEWLWMRREQRRLGDAGVPWVGYERKDSTTSIGMGLGSLVVGVVGDLALVAVVALLNRVTPLQVPSTAWWALPLTVLAVDFAFYWSHRLHHEVRFMWAAHVNHHSSTHYNLSTALRQSWTEHLTGLPFYIALGLLGFGADLILASFAINLLYQFWVHTELLRSLGPIEWLFNTPSHHRVHHGSNPEYLDRNYGGILIIWDRLFGTFEPERAPVDYGLVTNVTSHNLLVVAFHEWRTMIGQVRQARGKREVLGRIFGRPGYDPEGRTLTAPQIRAQAEAVRAQQASGSAAPTAAAAQPGG
jgi:sterol desaturase/sphingolipid hydroxylase (fatty acid hydroxylase superfamily)